MYKCLSGSVPVVGPLSNHKTAQPQYCPDGSKLAEGMQSITN